MRLRHKERVNVWLEQGAQVLLNPNDTSPLSETLWENYNKLHLEVGCGRGAFLSQLCETQPQTFFLGIDRIPLIAARAAAILAEQQLTNMRVASGDIDDFAKRLPSHCVEVIYLNFSDPWPRRKQASRRLTHSSKLAIYQELLTASGFLEFKTDNALLFNWSITSLNQSNWTIEDVTHALPIDVDHHSPKFLQTDYEQRFRALGLPIHYLRAFPPQ